MLGQVYLMDIFVDVTNRQLTLGEQHRQLEPKVYLLLQVLIQANGDIVSRDQLIEQVWQGRIVGDGAINRTVSLLRQHLTALDNENNFVITVPKAGYKLMHIKKTQLISTDKTNIKISSTLMVSLIGAALLLLIGISFLYQSTVTFEKTSRLTTKFGAEYDISVDQTGDNLVYQHFDNHSLSRQLYLFNSVHGDKKLILDKKVRNSAISANGHLLAISYTDKDLCHIAFYNFSTQTTKDIQNCATDSIARFTWHWNSENIYFRSRENKTKPYTINRYNVKTAHKSQFTLPPGHTNLLGDYLLDHHPNKNWLLVARYIDEHNTQLIILESLTSEIIFSYQVPHHISALSWLDKEYATFSEHGAVYLINIVSGEISFQFNGGQSINSMDATKKSLFFSTFERANHIYKHNIMTGERVPIDENNTISRLPKIRKNDQISYLSKKQSSFQWLLADGEKQSSLVLNLPFELGFDRYEWSEDGRHILLAKQGAIYQINVDDNKYTKLSDNELGTNIVNYDPTGNIIYNSNRSGQWQLWLFQVNANTHKQLTQHGGYSGRIYGNELFFTKFNENGLWQLNLVTGTEKKLIADVDMINWLNWQLINNNIYFYRPDSGIWKYALATGAETLILAPEKRFLHQYSVSSDEKTIYFVERQNMEGDIYEVPFNINE